MKTYMYRERMLVTAENRTNKQKHLQHTGFQRRELLDREQITNKPRSSQLALTDNNKASPKRSKAKDLEGVGDGSSKKRSPKKEKKGGKKKSAKGLE